MLYFQIITNLLRLLITLSVHSGGSLQFVLPFCFTAGVAVIDAVSERTHVVVITGAITLCTILFYKPTTITCQQ
jgi:hypothetical protein